MSASTIIADLEADFSNISTNGKAFIATLVGRVTALENTFSAAGPALESAFSDASALVTATLGEGATVAAAAVNPTTFAIAIGAVAAPVSQIFVEGFNLAKGFLEGVEGQTPATGATTQETDGAAAGTEVKNLFDAVRDSLKTL
jgi:ornithine cyclodeaminase/alanine dehydrogenase-like protein (mu-crystallin family)